ncbi:hypothetical protein NVP1170O_036 [Vibrio phage 1.170.O._10N.261.52.C3]|nr:hypothetical protein NVP1170O_036 [Vibrio phage 1.170.O._10N.261.52.C3]
MIKQIIATGILVWSFNASAVGQDKYLHFGVSTAIGGVVTYAYEGDWRVGFGSCMVVGVAKETYDYLDYGKFDTQDLAFDAVGCALGSWLGYETFKLTSDSDSVMINYEIKW